MDTTQILTVLRAQRDRISAAITALEALNGNGVSQPKATVAAPASKTSKKVAVVPPTTRKRVVSAEARQRMAEAQKKRWAKNKRAAKSAAAKTPAAKTATA
jgi:hypothetical protein